MNYIYSTISTDIEYVKYRKSQNINIIEEKVLIKGGANIAKAGRDSIYTPCGYVTQVNDDQLEILRNSSVFQDHLKKGLVKIETKKIDIEKAVKDMSKKDSLAPLTKYDAERMNVREYQPHAA
jgi:hypothetical protein